MDEDVNFNFLIANGRIQPKHSSLYKCLNYAPIMEYNVAFKKNENLSVIQFHLRKMAMWTRLCLTPRTHLGEHTLHVCSSGERTAVGLSLDTLGPGPRRGRPAARGTQPFTRNPSTPGPVKSPWLDSFITL